MDEPRACYTEWSESEREKQILYINAYIWNLERKYWGSYLQSSKGNADIKNRLLDTGEEEYGMIWENSIETYITMCKIDSQWEIEVWYREPNLVLCNNLEVRDGAGGGREVKEGGEYVYPWLFHVDVWKKSSQYCNYPPINNKVKLEKKKRVCSLLLLGSVQFSCSVKSDSLQPHASLSIIISWSPPKPMSIEPSNHLILNLVG